MWTLISQLPPQILDNIKEYLAQRSDKSTMPSFDETMKQLEDSMYQHCLPIFLQAVETGVQEYVDNSNTTDTPTQHPPSGNVYLIRDRINQETKTIKKNSGHGLAV